MLMLLAVPIKPLEAAPKYASMVIDAQTGVVLHAVDANETYHPASLTKLMTLYMTFQALATRDLRLDQQLTVSKYAARQPSSKLWMHPDSTLTVREAILALVVRSANDAAVVLAEAIGGTEKKFAQKMTQEALKLGMTRTRFQNASGLHHSGQVSTARDMALLTRALMLQFPQYYHFFGAKKFKFRDNMIYTHNHFVKTYNGADGLKTGYVDASGFNLAASAVRHNTRLIGVVFGGRTAKWRDQHMTKLLDHGFTKAREIRIAQATSTAPKPRRKPRFKGASQQLALSQPGTNSGMNTPQFNR